jgi:hypothetical protein
LPRKSKYRNQPVVIDGLRFPSISEAERWQELKILERAGQITHLERQVSFTLYTKNAVALHKIVIDYIYFESGKRIAEDRKGIVTDLARAKLNHLAADYNLEVRITRKGKPDEIVARKAAA